MSGIWLLIQKVIRIQTVTVAIGVWAVFTIDQDSVKRNPAYYVVAHAAKFVRPGSVRIASNLINGLPNVAFKTPDHKIVLIVINNGSAVQTFNISYKGKKAIAQLNTGSVGTFVWKQGLKSL